jgi:hypothetical protein
VGVSCATASECVAVGSSENKVKKTFIVHTLAEVGHRSCDQRLLPPSLDAIHSAEGTG